MLNIIEKITLVEDVCLITLENIPANSTTLKNIFTAMSAENINVDMINQSAKRSEYIDISFTIESTNISKALTKLNILRSELQNININASPGHFKVSFFSEKMRTTPGVATDIFTMLAKNNIDITLITTSETDISCLFSDVHRGVIDKIIKVDA